jgi:hypothetical protein
MRNIQTAAAVAMWTGSSCVASVLKYKISAGTSVTPHPATISFSLDCAIVIPNLVGATSGLSLIASNFDPGVLGYKYSAAANQLRVFGLPSFTLSAGANDFDAIILSSDVFFNGTSLASVQQFIFTQVGTSNVVFGSAPSVTAREENVGSVPVPRALPLVATALLLVAGGATAGRRQPRPAVSAA